MNDIKLDISKLIDKNEDSGTHSWIVCNGKNINNEFRILFDKFQEISCSNKSKTAELIAKNVGCSKDHILDLYSGRTEWISLNVLIVLHRLLNGLGYILDFSIISEKIEKLKPNTTSKKIVNSIKVLDERLAEFCGVVAADGTIGMQIIAEDENEDLLKELEIVLNSKLNLITNRRKRKDSNLYQLTLYVNEKSRIEALRLIKDHRIAYSTGHILGFVDGQKPNMEYLKALINELFGINATIREKGNGKYSIIFFRNKIVSRYLRNLLDFPVGDKSHVIDAPNLIKEAPLDIQRAFVRGFVQFDGTVKMKGNVAVTTYSKNMINFFISVISKDGLQFNFTERPTGGYDIESSKSVPEEAWLEYFTPKTFKWQRLQEVIFGYKIKTKNINETLEILKQSYPPNSNSTTTMTEVMLKSMELSEFSIKQMAGSLNINYKVAEVFLNNLVKMNILKVQCISNLDKFKKLSNIYTYNENINDWRIPKIVRSSLDIPNRN